MEESANETELSQALTPVINNNLNTAAEFKGKDDEEDLLLTAQRYLNIFHQIHIFKEFRKKQFDKELMDTPLKVRKVIALLPGGRILLEHIAELYEAAKMKDAALEKILASLAKKSHLANEEMASIGTTAANAPQLSAPNTAPIGVSASVELGKNFTDALTDSFKAYSQNIQELSNNIKKMISTGNAASGTGTASVGEDFTASLNDSFKAYARNIQDLSESIKQIAVNNRTADINNASAQALPELASSIAELSANIQKISAEKSPSLTYSTDQALPELAASIAELSANIHKISVEKHPALTYSAEQALPELASSIAELSANINKISTISNTVPHNEDRQAIPEFTSSIAELLKENAQQQMNVLKTFGETISKTITESQKDLINSLKNSPQNSMIIGKFMQVPTASNIDDSTTEAIIINEQPTDYSSSANSSDETPQYITNQPQKAQTVNQPQPVKQPAENKAKNKSPAETNKTTDHKPEKVKLAEPYISKNNSAKNKKPATPNKSTISDFIAEDVDINDVFAQLAPDVDKQNNTKQTPEKSASTNKKNNKSATENAPANNTAYDSAMQKIKNALDSQDTISLDDFDITPVSLSAADDTDISAPSSIEEAQQSIEDALNDAFTDTPSFENTEPVAADDIYQADDNSTDNGSDNNDDWEYEYVDEDGNPVEPSEDNDGDWEYEYVDEDGNTVEQPDNKEEDWEYEYVDEDGNPVEPSDDDEGDWEYEYVDENGNPVES